MATPTWVGWGREYPVDVRFPRSVHSGIYDTQLYVQLPSALTVQYGLEPEWGLLLRNGKRVLEVFVPMRPGCTRDPGIAIWILRPEVVLPPVELKVNGGFASAVIELAEPINMQDCEGQVVLLAERTEQREWLPEPDLLREVMHILVTTLTWRMVLRRILSDIKLVRNFYRAVSGLVDELEHWFPKART